MLWALPFTEVSHHIRNIAPFIQLRLVMATVPLSDCPSLSPLPGGLNSSYTESLGELFVKYQGQDKGLEPVKPEELAKLISVDHFKGSSGGATLSA